MRRTGIARCAAAIGAVLLFGGQAWAASVDVVDQGVTRLVATGASAELTTRRAAAAEAMAGHATMCSGGRVQCSLVDRLVLKVGGHDVDVPRRATVLLADVNRARLVRLAAGHYELVLRCGDAAVAYEARLFFGPRRLARMDIWASEAGRLEQRTLYRDVPGAFL